jgi:hypothetical protein
MSRLKLFTACALLAALPVIGAEPEPRLQDAVGAYERGEFPRAAAAFGRLSAEGVAAADYNLAVMHLRRELPRASDAQGVSLMTRAAPATSARSTSYASMYERATASPRDLRLARYWYAAAAAPRRPGGAGQGAKESTGPTGRTADADARYSTTLTIGCVDSVRYSSSSCSRLVAVTVIVTPRYLPPLLGRVSTVRRRSPGRTARHRDHARRRSRRHAPPSP